MSFFVHESSYVDEDVVIGDETKIWYFCHIQKGARIGNKCTLGQNVNIGNNVVIGESCQIQNNVSIYEGVTLEDGVFCGPSCVFTNDMVPRTTVFKQDWTCLKTNVGKGASIGANATIVCGHGSSRSSCYKGCAGLCIGCRSSCKDYRLCESARGNCETL